jgi:hypothetical protein
MTEVHWSSTWPKDYDGILVSLDLYCFQSETFDIKAQNLTHWPPSDPGKCRRLKYKGHSESSASRKISPTCSVFLKWNLPQPIGRSLSFSLPWCTDWLNSGLNFIQLKMDNSFSCWSASNSKQSLRFQHMKMKLPSEFNGDYWQFMVKNCTINPRLRCIRGISWRAQSINE